VEIKEQVLRISGVHLLLEKQKILFLLQFPDPAPELVPALDEPLPFSVILAFPSPLKRAGTGEQAILCFYC
jgi:hypothetical protein